MGLRTSTILYTYGFILAVTGTTIGVKKLEQLIDQGPLKIKQVITKSVDPNCGYFNNLINIYTHPEFLEFMSSNISKVLNSRDPLNYLPLSSIYAFGLGYYFRRKND